MKELYSQTIAGFGERLFGPEWGTAMARLTGTNQRTISRIKVAAAEGREYPSARGVLAALHDALSEIMRDLKPHGRRAAKETDNGA